MGYEKAGTYVLKHDIRMLQKTFLPKKFRNAVRIAKKTEQKMPKIDKKWKKLNMHVLD